MGFLDFLYSLCPGLLLFLPEINHAHHLMFDLFSVLSLIVLEYAPNICYIFHCNLKFFNFNLL